MSEPRKSTLQEISTVATLRSVSFHLDTASRSADLDAELDRKAAEIQERIARQSVATGLRALPEAELSLVDFTGIGGLLEDAKANLQDGDIELAMALLEELLADEPEHREARYLMARCLYELGGDSLMPALRILGPLREQTAGTEVAEQVRELRGQLRMLLVPKAVVAFSATVRTDPDSAITAMRELIELAPEEGSCYQVLAIALAIGGQPMEALLVAESGMRDADTDRDTIEQLARRLRLVLVRPLAAQAVSAFKRGDPQTAALHLRALDPYWRSTPVIRDFQAQLERDVLSQLPAKRAADLYSLIAENEVDFALTLIEQGKLPHAEAVLATVLPVVPGYPWLNFLYALAVFLQGGDPARSSRAAKIAATDPSIGQAKELLQAIRRQQENELINPAIEEFNAIVEAIPRGGSTPQQLQDAKRALQAVAKGLPALRRQVFTDEGGQTVTLLGQVIDRHLASIDAALAIGSLYDRFDKIMRTVTGPLSTSAQADRLKSQLDSLATDVTRQRASAPAKEQFDELAKLLNDTRRQAAEAGAALAAGELVGEFNRLMESARYGVTPSTAYQLKQDMATISGKAANLKSGADATTRKNLDDLISATQQVMRQLT